MQKWLSTQKFDSLTLIAVNKYRGNIQWANASTLKGDTTASYDFVPVKLDTATNFDNKLLTLNKYLVLTKLNGAITGGTLVEVLGDKSNEAGFTQLIANYGHKTQASFTGIVTINAISGAFKESKQYTTGTMVSHKIIQAFGVNNNKTTLSTGAKITNDCYNYYLVVYDDDGNIYDSEFLYQECDGSGSGCAETAVYGHKSVQSLVSNCSTNQGGGGGTQANCADSQEYQDFVNSTQGNPDQTLISITTASSTATTRIKSYNWSFYTSTLGLWDFISSETGTHVFVNNQWQFQSLVHSNIALSGAVLVGGTLTINLISATPTVGTYNAIMALTFTATSSFACAKSPLSWTTDPITSTAAFNVNQ